MTRSQRHLREIYGYDSSGFSENAGPVIDITPPLITTTSPYALFENNALSLQLTANEPVFWTKVGGEDQSLFIVSGDQLTMTAKDFETPIDSNADNQYIVQVRATDAAGNFSNKAIVIQIIDRDETAPIITSTNNATQPENTPYSLSLTANKTVTWSKAGGADQALFNLTNNVLTMVARDYETPVDNGANNTYQLIVRATDIGGNFTDQLFTLTISDRDEISPTITSAATFTVNENTAFSQGLTANEAVTWSKTGGTDASLFVLAGSTLSMIARDFEAPADSDANNTYSVQVTATDNAGNFTNQTIVLTVLDIDDSAPVINTAAGQNVNENSAFSVTLTANKSVTWSKVGGADAALFTLAGADLSLTAKDFEIPVDADTNNTYVVVIRATATVNSLTTDKTITVTVADVNDSVPVITSSSTGTVVENSAFSKPLTANSTVTWTIVGGADQARFAIAGNNLTMTAKDFEVPIDADTNNVYVVTVRATNGGGTADQTISVTVTNIDDTAPTITSSNTGTTPENAAFSKSLTANETVTWSKVGGADTALFGLTGATLTMTAKNYEAPADADANNTYLVTVRATDTAGNFTDQTITVTVTDVDDTAPTITSSATTSINEATTLGFALTANETVTWAIIGGVDAAKFELSGSTLRWAGNGVKDYEAPDDSDTNNTYLVQVRATDTAGNSSTQSITVTVNNVAETFTITSSNSASNVENTTLSKALTASSSATWTILGGADAAKFEISGTNLRWASNGTKDYEAPDDADNNNTYIVTIRATQVSGGTAPTQGSNASLNYANRTNTVVNKPAGVVSGTLMVAHIFMQSTPFASPVAVTPPAGWTLWNTSLYTGNASPDNYINKAYVYFKIAGGSEPSSYTWTHSASYSEGLITSWTGVDATTPLDKAVVDASSFSDGVGSSGKTELIDPGTTVTNNAIVAIYSTQWDAAGAGSWSGSTPTLVTDYTGTVTKLASGTMATAGAVGSRTRTNGNGSTPDDVGWTAVAYVLRPASGGGGGATADQSVTVTVTDAAEGGTFVKPDATNTGDLSGVARTTYATKSITAASTVVSHKNISGSVIRVQAANVIFEYCVFTSPTDDFAIDAEGSTGLIVRDCTFTRPDGLGNAPILTGANSQVLRNDISGYSNGIVIQDGTNVTRGNYLHDLGPPGGAGAAHVDGISCQGGQNGVLIEGNTIYGWDTSCIFVSADFGPANNVTIKNNWLLNQPGRQTAYPQYWGSSTGTAIMQDNFMQRGAYGYNSQTGVPQLVWTNNRNYDTNALIGINE